MSGWTVFCGYGGPVTRTPIAPAETYEQPTLFEQG